MESDTAFILLAGGKSKRMGVDKGLLKYKQTFWILEQLSRISKTSISNVFIGLGYNYQHYFDAIPWFKNATNNYIDFQGLRIKIIINKQPEYGTFSTLQTVLKKLDSTCSILLNPIDVPILNSLELDKIITTKNNIIIPNYEGKNGHPIKMECIFWKHLLDLNNTNDKVRLDFQIKKIESSKISTIKVNDNAIITNLNTKEDWSNFLRKNL